MLVIKTLGLIVMVYQGLEKEMATHSSILAWEMSWTEEPGGQATVHNVAKRAGHDLVTKQPPSTF